MVMLLQSPGTRCWSWVPPGPTGWYETTYSVAAPGLSHVSSMELSLIPVTRRFSGGATDGKGRGKESVRVCVAYPPTHPWGRVRGSAGGTWAWALGWGLCVICGCINCYSKAKAQESLTSAALAPRVYHRCWDELCWHFARLPNFCPWCL